jgi:hypothetical protein
LHIVVHLVIALTLAGNVDAGVAPTDSPSRGPLQPSTDYDLQPVKDGTGDLAYDGTGFTARVARDGAVTFRDKHLTVSLALLPHLGRGAVPSGVPSLESILRGHGTKRAAPPPVSAEEQAALYGSRLPIPTVTPYRPDPREVCQYPQPCFFNATLLPLSVKGGFDLTDELMRLGGQDAYRYAKAQFLAGTREMRIRMAARAHADDVRNSVTGLSDQLDAIACDGRRIVNERRAIIEALGAELDSSKPEGRAAQAEITRFLARFGQPNGASPCPVR